jgi:hypothetical protein
MGFTKRVMFYCKAFEAGAGSGPGKGQEPAAAHQPPIADR